MSAITDAHDPSGLRPPPHARRGEGKRGRAYDSHHQGEGAGSLRRGYLCLGGLLDGRGRPHRPLPGERQSLGPRQPRRRPRAALRGAEEERHRGGRRHGRRPGRHAGDRRGRRQVRLRPDGDAAGRPDRHRQVPQQRPLRRDPAQCGPCRPGRRLGRDGGRGGAGLDPLRQRLGQRAGGALWRRAAALLDRALLRGRAAAGPRPAGARLRHLDRGRGQGAGGEPGRQEDCPTAR